MNSKFTGLTLDEILHNGWCGDYQEMTVEDWAYIENLVTALKEEVDILTKELLEEAWDE